MSESEFETLLKGAQYRLLGMKRHWPDTVLTEIYLSPKSIAGISAFLHDQRSNILEEEEGSIPDTGE